jgi:hypothetical protein
VAMEGLRLHRHRLTPSRALTNPAEAREFVREMGIILRTPDPYLPSLFAAAQGRPYKEGVGGFGNWPEHAWWWDGELTKDGDILISKVIGGRTAFVARSCWPALDAAVRGRASQLTNDVERHFVACLRMEGTIRADDLRGLMGLESKDKKNIFQKARTRLEKLGVILTEYTPLNIHRHVSMLALWEHRFPSPLTAAHGVALILRAVVAAAGQFPEKNLNSLFAWPSEETEMAIESLVQSGILSRNSGTLTIDPATR